KMNCKPLEGWEAATPLRHGRYCLRLSLLSGDYSLTFDVQNRSLDVTTSCILLELYRRRLTLLCGGIAHTSQATSLTASFTTLLVGSSIRSRPLRTIILMVVALRCL